MIFCQEILREDVLTIRFLSKLTGNLVAAFPEADLGLLQHPRWSSWKPLTIITKRSILDAAAVLDPPVSGSNIRTILLQSFRNGQGQGTTAV